MGEWLQGVGDVAQARFLEEHGARERALRSSREIVRNSANSIRAAHRGEFAAADELLETVAELAGGMMDILQSHPRVY